jgi:hypothetical protein
MLQESCPGYFERDVQEIIDAKGPIFTAFFCALCGQQVMPVNKDGGWAPTNHSAYRAIQKD